MATKAQREAHRRYALKAVGDLTHSRKWTSTFHAELSLSAEMSTLEEFGLASFELPPLEEWLRSGTWPYVGKAHWSYTEIAAVLTKQGVFTPAGKTEWTPRLVAALLVWDAFLASDTERLDLMQFIGDREEAAREFEGLQFGQQTEEMSSEVRQAVKCADKVLHEGDSGDAVMPALTLGHQAAYREYALNIVQGLTEGPWKYGDVATVLTMRTIPTLNGRPNWRPNQVQRLIKTGQPSWAKRFEAPERLHSASERPETAEGSNEKDDDSETQDIPF